MSLAYFDSNNFAEIDRLQSILDRRHQSEQILKLIRSRTDRNDAELSLS